MAVLLVPAAPARAESRSVEVERWEALHEASRDAVTAASELVARAQRSGIRRPTTEERPLTWEPFTGDALPYQPAVIVVGFTGGLEGRESSVSGVVRMSSSVGRHFGELPQVVSLAYNNFNWREAGRDVVKLASGVDDDARTGSPGKRATAALPQPLIIVYGHSWGAGSIAKFARRLRDEQLEVSLAIYIDAFTVRNPRVPDNVRQAVNFYQRTGILRGLPLRGKRKLIPESTESTAILGSYRIKPDTNRFGWSWNLLQPLLYRHHHRIGHDERLERFLLEAIAVKLELLAGHRGPVTAARTGTARK